MPRRQNSLECQGPRDRPVKTTPANFSSFNTPSPPDIMLLGMPPKLSATLGLYFCFLVLSCVDIQHARTVVAKLVTPQMVQTAAQDRSTYSVYLLQRVLSGGKPSAAYDCDSLCSGGINPISFDNARACRNIPAQGRASVDREARSTKHLHCSGDLLNHSLCPGLHRRLGGMVMRRQVCVLPKLRHQGT